MLKTSERFLSQLTRHEGLVLTTYRCTAGKLTIGVGHNLDTSPIPGIHEGSVITKEWAMQILADDVEKCEKNLDRKLPWWRNLNEPRQAVIANMCFNLGIHNLLGFKNTLALVKAGNYLRASNGMLNSKWARQVKGRATELARQMQTGEWGND